MVQKMRTSEVNATKSHISTSSPQTGKNDKSGLASLTKHVRKLTAQDRANVRMGLYPPQKLAKPHALLKAVDRAGRVIRDADAVNKRRKEKNGSEIRNTKALNPQRYPAYYQQNFHFQTDGWLGDESAEIYDTQVETLFLGTADTMRRAALAELSLRLKRYTGENAHLLDLGCGNGHMMAMIASIWPRLCLTGLDLSPNYLSLARRINFNNKRRVDFIQGAAEAIPMEPKSVDFVLASYLFHELPHKIRKQVAREAHRVLKPGGYFIFSDSLQLGDTPELDRLLRFFPTEFHEPFYNSYLNEDFNKMFKDVGFQSNDTTRLAFLTKVTIWHKP